MKNLRSVATVIAWAGLIWMLFTDASERRISENFFVDLSYNTAMVLFAVLIVMTTTIFIERLLRPSILVLTTIAGFLVVALAAIEVFWLCDLIAQP